MIKCNTHSYLRWDIFLLAIVINANIFRFLLGGKGETVLYLFYIFCFLSLWRYQKRLHSLLQTYNDLKVIYLLSVVVFAYALLSCLWLPIQERVFLIAKFLLTLLLTAFIPLLTKRTISKIIILSIFFNIIYCGIVLYYPEKIDQYMEGDANYLNATLTIGLIFTYSLTSVFYYYLNGNNLKLLCWVGVSYLVIMTLFRFSARGVLLFPPAIAILLLPFMGRNKIVKATMLFLFVGFLISVVANFYIENNSGYTLRHMQSLFESTEEESRLDIWTKSISLICDNLWFILGGGLNVFMEEVNYYPHNLFLQLIGEYGVIGLLWIFLFILISFRFFKGILFVRHEQDEILNYYVIGGFLYYFFTFSKSFSFYDALPLLISFMFCVVMSDKYRLKNHYSHV